MAILNLTLRTFRPSKTKPSLEIVEEVTVTKNIVDGDDDVRLFMTASPLWKLLSWMLPASSKDSTFWWQTTGAVLAEALYQAQYSLIGQLRALYFYNSTLVPRLGPRPSRTVHADRWNSFMTDDYTPIEYSWNWGTGAKSPDVRYSIEPIGLEAGSSLDPFNQSMTTDLVAVLQQKLPHTDWTWFHAFYEAFRVPSTQTPTVALSTPLAEVRDPNHSSPSSIFLAFEHHRAGPAVPKAYFVPSRSTRSLEGIESPVTVATNALKSVPTHSSDLTSSFPAYVQLLDFLHTHPLGQELSLIFLAIDCVPWPQESRLKIYLRSPRTDFDSVVAILSMAGKLAHLASLETPHVSKLKPLFHALLDQRPDSPADGEAHETAGMLYYFDCAPSQQLPRPKIYIPAKHYASSDAGAWAALSTWLKDDRGPEYAGRWCPRFQSLLGTMGVDFTPRKDVRKVGDSRERCQTYVSVGFEKGGELNVTSYLGPAIYAKLEGLTSPRCVTVV